MQVTPRSEEFRLAETFTISRGSRDVAKVLSVLVEQDGVTGWGEDFVISPKLLGLGKSSNRSSR